MLISSMESANAIVLILLFPILQLAKKYAANQIALMANIGALAKNNVIAQEAQSSNQMDAFTRALMMVLFSKLLWLRAI
jgi:hypothetical protein